MLVYAVPGSTVRAREIDCKIIDVSHLAARTDHVQRSVWQLLHIHIVHIQKCPVRNDVISDSKVEEIGCARAVNLVERNILSIPSAVEHAPTAVWLFQRPWGIDVLIRSCRPGRKHWHTNVRNPVKCVFLPVPGIERTRTYALNFDCSGWGLASYRLQLRHASALDIDSVGLCCRLLVCVLYLNCEGCRLCGIGCSSNGSGAGRNV